MAEYKFHKTEEWSRFRSEGYRASDRPMAPHPDDSSNSTRWSNVSTKPKPISSRDDPLRADVRVKRLEITQVDERAGVAPVNDPERIREQIREFRRGQGSAENVGVPAEGSNGSEPGESSPFDLVVRGQRVLFDGDVCPREVGVVEGRIGRYRTSRRWS